MYSLLSYSLFFLSSFLMLLPSAQADQNLRRIYQTARTAAMGNVRLSTGLYDDNFFGNPARATANELPRFSILDFTPLEISTSTLSNIKAVQAATSSSSKDYSQFLDDRMHVRSQLFLAAYYQPPSETKPWAIATGLFTSLQADIITHRNYTIDDDGIFELGPVLTTTYLFLKDRSLSVGINTRLSYRVSLDPDYSLLEIVQGKDFQLSSGSGAGGMIDFDLGTTYSFLTLGSFHFLGAASVQNLLGGAYQQFKWGPKNFTSPPFPQPRNFGVGLSMARPSSWWVFSKTLFALEVTDIGNNLEGSTYKLLHFGAETHWKSFSIQVGINQGYLCAGLGFQWKSLLARVATYGEEIGLNAGEDESRRVVFNFGIHL